MKRITILGIIVVSLLLYLRFTQTTRVPAETETGFDMAIPEIPATPIQNTQTNTNPSVLATLPSGHNIDLYHFGPDKVDVLIIGSIHGSYEISTKMFVDSMIAELQNGSFTIPNNLGVSLIPCMNPVGCAGEPGNWAGRFNSNDVDLNRNWGTLWEPTAIMLDGVTPLNPGTGPFSEPENVAIKEYIERVRPRLTVFYHCCIDPGFIFLNSTAVNSGIFQPYMDYSRFDVDPHDIILPGGSTEYLDEIGLNGVEVEFLRSQRTSPDVNFHLEAWRILLASIK